MPELRKAAATSRVYHLRDTHWNALGNAVAGRELARFLAAEPALREDRRGR